jgi:hypothetical protein
MTLLRFSMELDYTDMSLRCNHYPKVVDEPTVVEIDGREYPAVLSIQQDVENPFSFIISIGVCKNDK